MNGGDWMDEPKLLGYVSKECNNCGRVRVEEYSDGSLICEKCYWDQIDNYKFPDDYL